jgi:hypothetical protein
MAFVRAALALTILSLLTATAAAQRPDFGLPDRAVLVAGPISGARLYVWDERSGLCGALVQKGSESGSCGAGDPELSHPMISFDQGGRGSPSFIWGFVPPEVVSVELVSADGRRIPARTTAGSPYHGKHAGEVRFFLQEARLRRGDAPLYVRLLDADGALLAAVDTAFLGDGDHRGAAQVARGRLAAARWALRAFAARQLAPLPGDEERVVTRHCVALEVRRSGSGWDPLQTGSYACDDPDYLRPVDMDVSRSCGPAGIQISGLADAGVRLRAVLGDGSRRRVALHSLPPRFAGRRAFALVLAPTVALRQLVAIEDGRREVEVDGIAPGVFDCPGSSTGYLFAFGSEPAFGPGPPALQLRDDGVLLCATLGMPDPERGDCGRPPLDAESSWVLTHETDDATLVAGVVPPEVGSAAVVLGNGQSQAVPTAPPGGYSGRYRDLIRTFSLSIPGRQEVRRVVLFGLDGKRLFATRLFTPPTFEIEPALLKRTPSGWRLGVGQVRFAGRHVPCVQLARGDFSLEPLACAFGRSRMVRAACSPKRTLLFGWLPGVRSVEVTTTRRRFSQRGLSARRLGIRRLAFVVELGPNEALRSLRFPGRKPQRFRIPPAAQQCGYEEEVTWR